MALVKYINTEPKAKSDLELKWEERDRVRAARVIKEFQRKAVAFYSDHLNKNSKKIV